MNRSLFPARLLFRSKCSIQLQVLKISGVNALWFAVFTTPSPQPSETMNIPFRIVLFAPEIPQNTGTIGRLCVCCGAELHLIEPLGFEVTETRLRRAGLDYWHHLTWRVHPSWPAFVNEQAPKRLFFATAHARRTVYQAAFRAGDWLVFGNETGGLPQAIHEQYAEHMVTIPMPGEHARTHNLANAVAIVLHEALRQTEGW